MTRTPYPVLSLLHLALNWAGVWLVSGGLHWDGLEGVGDNGSSPRLGGRALLSSARPPTGHIRLCVSPGGYIPKTQTQFTPKSKQGSVRRRARKQQDIKVKATFRAPEPSLCPLRPAKMLLPSQKET